MKTLGIHFQAQETATAKVLKMLAAIAYSKKTGKTREIHSRWDQKCVAILRFVRPWIFWISVGLYHYNYECKMESHRKILNIRFKGSFSRTKIITIQDRLHESWYIHILKRMQQLKFSSKKYIHIMRYLWWNGNIKHAHFSIYRIVLIYNNKIYFVFYRICKCIY